MVHLAALDSSCPRALYAEVQLEIKVIKFIVQVYCLVTWQGTSAGRLHTILQFFYIHLVMLLSSLEPYFLLTTRGIRTTRAAKF